MSKKSFLNLLSNKSIKHFISFSSIFSFVSGNFIIFFILSSFFNFIGIEKVSEGIVKWGFFTLGLFFSFLLIKTHYFIRIKKNKNKKKKEVKDVLDYSGKIKLGFWNTLIILIRLLFFNIMNDLFIILVTWLVIFSAGYLFGFISIIGSNFNVLIGLITIIGIISGIFQFYIQNYREKISQQIINSITKNMSRLVKKYSFNDFIEYTKKQKNNIHSSIESNLKTNQALPMLKVFKDLRGGRDVTNVTFNVNAGNDGLLAQTLEFSGIDKLKLINAYKIYFESKNKEIKKEINKLDLNDLRKNLLPNIIFFDEAIAQLISSEYSLEKIDEPDSYIEFLNKYAQDNVMYFIDKLLQFKS